ncbi:hypothetical protein [uncultured Nostoc sp.]|uniref:hypothetical protein n=1 Tax=uncultured Nostoc sp. TaxID=340711 RepID=UPI0035CAE59C
MNDDDLIELADILLISQKVKAREALCLRIGIDPNQLAFIRDGAERDFVIQLINYLNQINEQEALCKLCCKELIPVFNHGTYTHFLRGIAAKLHCNQGLSQNALNNKQPIVPSSIPASSAINKLIIGGTILLIGLAGFSLFNQNKNSSSPPTQATPSTLEAKDKIPPIEPRRPKAYTPEPELPYDIGVYGYQVDESFFNTIINSVGYPVRKASQVYNSKPAWFADRSTVFYYDKSSKDFALSLAEKLTNSTSVQFAVQYVSPENSISVKPGNERQTFFIHLVGSSRNTCKTEHDAKDCL